MNRWAWVGIAVLLVLSVVGAGALYAGVAGGPAPLAIASVEGEVVRARGDAEEAGAPGMTLAAGDEVRTGSDGVAVISRGGKAPLRLAARSTLRIESIADELVEVRLRRGQLRARVRPDAGALRVLSGDRSVLATDAEVELLAGDDVFAVQATRGEVAVGGIAGQGRVGEGERLVDLGGGGAHVGPISDAPLLDVDWPDPSRAEEVEVVGRAEPGATVTLRVAGASGEARVGAAGTFAVRLPVGPGSHRATLDLVDVFGRESRQQGEVVRTAEAARFELRLDYEGR